MDNVIYSGVSLIALVIGVVQVIKRTNVKSEYIQYIAMALAFLIFGGSKLVAAYPDTQVFFDIIVTGLYGISATGLYDVARSMSSKKEPVQPTEWMPE